MNIVKKIVTTGVFAVLAASSFAVPAQASTPLSLVLPEISTLTAQIGKKIASELKVQLAQAVAAPRAARKIRPASVTIADTYTVVVEATRLPSLDTLTASDSIAERVRF